MTAAAGIHNGNGNSNSNGASPVVLAPAASLVLPERDEIHGMNVHQRIRWITAEARSLPKSNWNPEGGFPYAGHDQIVDMLRLLLAKYGINIYQEPIPDFTREMSLGGIEHLTRVWYEYEVVNVDAPDDKIIRHNWGEALDNGDKGVNKCSTVAEKMFMLRLFKIATHDDPDGHSADKTPNRSVSQNGGDKGRREWINAPGKNECEQCYQPITTARRGNKTWQSSQVVAASKRQFKKRLCVDCYLDAQAQAANRPEGETESSVAPPETPSEATRDRPSSESAPPGPASEVDNKDA